MVDKMVAAKVLMLVVVKVAKWVEVKAKMLAAGKASCLVAHLVFLMAELLVEWSVVK